MPCGSSSPGCLLSTMRRSRSRRSLPAGRPPSRRRSGSWRSWSGSKRRQRPSAKRRTWWRTGTATLPMPPTAARWSRLAGRQKRGGRDKPRRRPGAVPRRKQSRQDAAPGRRLRPPAGRLRSGSPRGRPGPTRRTSGLRRTAARASKAAGRGAAAAMPGLREGPAPPWAPPRPPAAQSAAILRRRAAATAGSMTQTPTTSINGWRRARGPRGAGSRWSRRAAAVGEAIARSPPPSGFALTRAATTATMNPFFIPSLPRSRGVPQRTL
mmetsp:Transcript_5383/g.14978  ORF Transcript_5383/g.14978 Transcript_5383/m.14978 type:complete len:267 (+) Transcript_5383:2149-2949(+)